MMDKIVLAGFGGQGVMFIGKLLAIAGMLSDLEVCWIPSYGPEMRGGTANCSVIISDKEIFSPVISLADAGIVLNKPSYDKFLPRIKQGGTLVMNSSLIHETETREDIEIIRLPASEIASEMNNPGVANMICLGALIHALKLVDYETLARAVEKETGKKNKELAGLNLEAIIKGMQAIK